ncbi:MAG: preprotein translocase subunit SecA [Pseudomonadota bacterium]|nr:preprotein translocase subunit SecA [Pseudomonadota bacterium]
MLQSFLRLIFGSQNDRFIKECSGIVTVINNLESTYEKLSDEQLRSHTSLFKERLHQGESLESLLPECFATVREVSKRTLGLRHHDVQLIGGIALHKGHISEMATGEGKTLVATLPVYLNALSEKGVHVVTVNHYLAKRDAEWMGQIYDFLGLSVGIIVPEMPLNEKKQAYAADITYASNNELGFDYLRDNMATEKTNIVQRGHHYAIIDEVDSILIDEARTPLIISGPSGHSSESYKTLYPLVEQLTGKEYMEDPAQSDDTEVVHDTDVIINVKERQVQLTEKGHDHIESLLKSKQVLAENEDLYSAKNAILLHFIEACLYAKFIQKKDTHYIVKNREILIIDEHTGRTLAGRRWSGGRHQAIEAKENVPVQQENQTLASITFQNYFRLYQKLSGMTGTADTEAEELEQIYNLQVIVIPKNKTCLRKDENDIIYMNRTEKYQAIVKDIIKRHQCNQPVLVGTTSIEDSEYLSSLLKEQSIPHQVLNAKQHAREAGIIAEAGEPGRITIATNMAGRGTDIILGGQWDRNLSSKKRGNSKAVADAKAHWRQRHEAVINAGGLHVIGAERHESRRVDNQLRGRCARQGDPGSSQFYLSLEDHLFRIFPQGVLNFIKNSSKKPGESLQASMLNRAISSNQKKMESYYYDIRKQLLKYDNIANQQRVTLYRERHNLLFMPSIHENIPSIFNTFFEELTENHKIDRSENIDFVRLQDTLETLFSHMPNTKNLRNSQEPEALLAAHYFQQYQHEISKIPTEQRDQIEKGIYLQLVDHHWKEHLLLMEDLRENIQFRGYAQKNPEQEYKIEAHRLFESLFTRVRSDFITQLSRLQINLETPASHEENSNNDTSKGIPMKTPLDIN